MSIGAGHGAEEPGPQEPDRSGKKWKLALCGLVGVFVVLACYGLITIGTGSNGSSAARPDSPSPAQTTTAFPTAAATAASSLPVVPTTSASVSASPSGSAASSSALHALTVTEVTAFGPEGTSDGDNPGIASRVANGGGGQPWYSSWYATPEFGNLQSGTGLLLDMGKAVTVASVRLVLGRPSGADVQLRVGDSATLASLTAVGYASDVGGTVQLSAASPASGRYVLIWFTKLPPGPQGHYQVIVYSATVDGSAEA